METRGPENRHREVQEEKDKYRQYPPVPGIKETPRVLNQFRNKANGKIDDRLDKESSRIDKNQTDNQ